MEYTFNRAEYADSAVLFDGCQEQPLDLDVSLPDYCPDIQRILKCQVTPCILGHSISGDRLEIDGSVRVRVLYLDSREDTVRCCEMDSGFSAAIPLREPGVRPCARVSARVEYVNCRAASPRRLDIHGAFSVCALVLDRRIQPICTQAQEEQLEQRQETAAASMLAGLGSQQFTVSETLEINDSKPPVETILRSRACCVVQDCRPVSGKLLAKGSLRIQVLYASGLDGASLENMEFEIPFSQMVDCDGAAEDCRCLLRMEVTDLTLQIRNDANGEAMRLDAEMRISALAQAYRDQEVRFITDAYSTEYETQPDYASLQLTCLDQVIQESIMQKTALEAGGQPVAQVLDVWNEMASVTGEIQNGQLVFSGKMNLCMLAADNQGAPFYLEKLADFSLSRPWNEDVGAGVGKVSCWALVTGLSFRITSNGGVEVSTEISVSGSVFHTISRKMVTGMHGDETCRKNDGGPALCLYYAAEGESLWDIARSHGVSLRILCEENGLTDTDEALSEGQMLLLASN